jgi:hypothetical protein
MTAGITAEAPGPGGAGPIVWPVVMDLANESGREFACPRCDRTFTARFYGPCQSCRDELIATMGLESAEVARPRYEPAMNVVPNQVATKE